MNVLQQIWKWIQAGPCPKDKQRTLFKSIINDYRSLTIAAKAAYKMHRADSKGTED